ncbi:hypothetical protein N656DRAFT_260863 [Canariomyces notabilis]|uniref:Uncharacterized protein n=1 Tax=Canariomyces notabilis TaxID=2074819 RepID=A0AAN6YWR7_9PEZI|nr:hypothetical protein N656DRAFT_260863 [Canariomyces arenarius]
MPMTDSGSFILWSTGQLGACFALRPLPPLPLTLRRRARRAISGRAELSAVEWLEGVLVACLCVYYTTYVVSSSNHWLKASIVQRLSCQRKNPVKSPLSCPDLETSPRLSPTA